MFKKIVGLASAAVMMFALAACGGQEEELPEEQIDYEIALVTDDSLIMNGGYSEVAWETITEYGASKGISHKYYKASEASADAYTQTVDAAVENGAKVVIADGYAFEQVIYNAQEKYPDVKFVLIDASPTDAESGDSQIGKNTVDILFASDQLGYLAGYSAVKEGYTELVFMGAGKRETTMDYGYGFLQGAEKAARENGTTVNIKYHYTVKDDDRESIKETASSWYESGRQLIFACGGDVEQPVIEAAELKGAKVIACETDKSQMSDVIITSAVKDIETAITTALEQYTDDEFPGGETVKYDAAGKGIWLDMENDRFSNFTESEYEDIFDMIASGEISVKKHDAGGFDTLGLKRVKVSEL